MRSTTEENTFLEPHSKLFILSQLEENDDDLNYEQIPEEKRPREKSNQLTAKKRQLMSHKSFTLPKINRLGKLRFSNSARKPKYDQYNDEFIPSTIFENGTD